MRTSQTMREWAVHENAAFDKRVFPAVGAADNFAAGGEGCGFGWLPRPLHASHDFS